MSKDTRIWEYTRLSDGAKIEIRVKMPCISGLDQMAVEFYGQKENESFYFGDGHDVIKYTKEKVGSAKLLRCFDSSKYDAYGNKVTAPETGAKE